MNTDIDDETIEWILEIESLLSDLCDHIEIMYLHGYYLVLVDDPSQTYNKRRIFETCYEPYLIQFLRSYKCNILQFSQGVK